MFYRDANVPPLRAHVRGRSVRWAPAGNTLGVPLSDSTAMCLQSMNPRFDQVEQIGSGFLAVMAKPVTGGWIEGEFADLAHAGIVQVVSLLELSEACELGLKNEKALCEKNNMNFLSYPIVDRGLPPSVIEFAKFTKTIYHDIAEGKNTVIHCRAGIGRSGMVAAGVLLHAAFEATEAFERISKARGVQVPDTPEQFNWVVTNQNAITSSA